MNAKKMTIQEKIRLMARLGFGTKEIGDHYNVHYHEVVALRYSNIETKTERIPVESKGYRWVNL